MSKRNKISLGTPTEELPEWTLSFDFTESQDTIQNGNDEKEEKEASPETVEASFSQPASSTPTTTASSSGLSGGLNTEFVIGNDNDADRSASTLQTAQPQNDWNQENVLDVSGFSQSSQNSESITTLDITDDIVENISTTTTVEPEPIPEPMPQPEPVPEPQPEPVPEPQPEPVPEPQPEPVP